MRTEVFVYYLGFTLKYSAGGGGVRGRDEARLAKMLIIIETGLWVHSGPLFFSIFVYV